MKGFSLRKTLPEKEVILDRKEALLDRKKTPLGKKIRKT